MKRVCFALCGLLVGCQYGDIPQKQMEAEARLAVLEKRIEQLSTDSQDASLRLVELKQSLESIQEKTKQQKQPEQKSGSWIMWQSQVSGPPNRLVGFREPQPMLAYSDQIDCEKDIKHNIVQFNGSGAMFTDSQGFTFRLSCLPKGIDPRSAESLR